MEQVLTWVLYGGLAILSGIIGWYSKSISETGHRNEDYDQSLGLTVTYLASGDIEKAQEVLTSVVAKNTEELHGYLTLGILFRKRGWFSRAVDVHRRLLSRKITDAKFRQRAMIELALDFEEAGLLDRAVEAIQQVIKISPSKENYLILSRIYETSSEWDLAVEALLQIDNCEDLQERISYLQVMQGLTCKKNNDFKRASKKFKASLKSTHLNPAGLLELAKLRAEQGKFKKAVILFEKLQEIRPDLTNLIVDSVEALLEKTGDTEFRTFFVNLMDEQLYKPRVAVRYAAYLLRENQKDRALKILMQIDYLKLAPEMLFRFIEIAQKLSEVELAKDAALQAVGVLVNHDRFICHYCGETHSRLEWRCQKCKSWGTIKYRMDYMESSQ